MDTQEITLGELNPQEFIEEKIREISDIVGDGLAINTLSGGVDSSTVTILGHRALGDRHRVYFVDNGLMREGEPRRVVELCDSFGVHVELVDASDKFFEELEGLTHPERKRKTIRRVFYHDVFGPLVRRNGAKYLLQGTNLTDIEETAVTKVKTQHNILEQIGINPEEMYGYKVIEPVRQLRKPAVRQVAKALGLPSSIYERPPFPGPALATRIVGEVTRERVALIRKAHVIVEEELKGTGAFQYFPVLYDCEVSSIRDEMRGVPVPVIEIRCWDTKDAVTAKPTELPREIRDRLAARLTTELPDDVYVTLGITSKPPSTMEAV